MEFPEVTAEMEGRKSERVEKNHGYCSVREANDDEEREREREGGTGISWTLRAVLFRRERDLAWSR